MTVSYSKTKTILVLLIIAVSYLCFGRASRASEITTRMEMTVTVDEVGNAGVQHDLKLPVDRYAIMKQTLGDPLHVMHAMENGISWLLVDNLRAAFDDRGHQIKSDFDCRGASRSTGRETWSMEFRSEDGFQLLDIDDQRATFVQVEMVNGQVTSNYVRVKLPGDATDIDYQATTGHLTYRLKPSYQTGDELAFQLDVQAQEHLVSGLAMMYGNEDSELFAARSILTNVGDQPIHDFRVRFRIANFSTWSRWKRVAIVHPGQTVLEAYYPVIDIDKVAKLNGTRHAMVEVEYSYTTEDGETIVDTDGRRTQLLARNEVVYSSRPDDQNLSWFDQFDLAPYILASFTSGTDTVIQQFSGRINARAGGLASSLNSEHAVKYLETMWEVLQENDLAYQTSPSFSINKHFGQHVKFGRDVLRNRAGTCIDLAILWASAAEAVGLRPHVAIVPGHAFPVIELPNGNLLPIESTMLHNTFDEAVSKGFAELEQWKKDGRIMLADVEELKKQGARSLDLPGLGEDILAVWGYDFEPKPVAEQAGAEQAVAESTTPSNETQSVPQSGGFVGRWAANQEVGDGRLEAQQVFREDGKYVFVMIFTDADGEVEKTEEFGTFVDRGDYFEFDTNLGEYDQPYVLNGNRLSLKFVDDDLWVHFTRIE